MTNILSVLLVIFLFHSSAYAADKIRIAVPEPNAAYMTYPLAYKKGFLTNQGVAAEVILMSGRLATPALNNGVRACTNTGVKAMLKRGKTRKRLTLLFRSVVALHGLLVRSGVSRGKGPINEMQDRRSDFRLSDRTQR